MLEFMKFVAPRIRINGRKRKRALYKCSCGEFYEADWSYVNTGKTFRCLKCSIKSSAERKIKHLLIEHPLYRKWQDMKNRCYNKNVDRYKNYGKRGIVVCGEWIHDFYSFYNWCINNGWTNGLQIDRINVDGNYDPSNCRIINFIEQGFNKTNTVYIQYKDMKYPLAKFLFENNAMDKYYMIYNGIKRYGKSIEYYIEKYNIQIIEIYKSKNK
jgi:hypothetical protein